MDSYRFVGVVAHSFGGGAIAYAGVDGAPRDGEPGVRGDDGAAALGVQL